MATPAVTASTVFPSVGIYTTRSPRATVAPPTKSTFEVFKRRVSAKASQAFKVAGNFADKVFTTCNLFYMASAITMYHNPTVFAVGAAAGFILKDVIFKVPKASQLLHKDSQLPISAAVITTITRKLPYLPLRLIYFHALSLAGGVVLGATLASKLQLDIKKIPQTVKESFNALRNFSIIPSSLTNLNRI